MASKRATPTITKAAKARAAELLAALRVHYPGAHCELLYSSPHELLIATILSAQTTDVNVNRATPALFTKFPTPQAFAASSSEEIEPFVRSLGFFRNKARAVHEAMKRVVEEFGGVVPSTMEELLSLRGVARKTANVVLGNAFNVNAGVVVDTHVERLSQRLGLAPKGSNVAAIEHYLMAQFPRDDWCELSHMLIFHGRRACKARGKECSAHEICRGFGKCCDLARTATKKPAATTASKAGDGPPKAVRRKASAAKAELTERARNTNAKGSRGRRKKPS
mgnify:CR=1 FL=1